MIGAYPKEYLADAMNMLGEMLDYAVNDYGAEGDEVADLFCMSSLARSCERGEPWIVSGLCGCEVFMRLAREMGYADTVYVEPAQRAGRSAEYWLGWTLAYAQWRLCTRFDEMLDRIPYDDLLALYHPWHEASEERVAELIGELMRSAHGETRLARARRELGLSQRELAHRSGVQLRSIQMYEQRNKDINHARAITVAALARVLRRPMEELLEPELP